MQSLTDEMCDKFRRMPCSFNDMIRHAYKSGADSRTAEVERLETALAELGVMPAEARSGVERSKARRTEVEWLTAENTTLQSLVPHPGDGSCDWCGFGPATPVTLCEECSGPKAEAVRP